MSHIKWAAFKWFIRDSAPNGDGSSSLFYTVNNCFTSITNQPTKKKITPPVTNERGISVTGICVPLSPKPYTNV